MRKTTTFILLLAIVSYGQENLLSDEIINASGANKIEFADGDEEIQNLAKSDIEKQIPFLLLRGGMNQFVSHLDEKFEKKYKVYFYNYGCLAPSEKVESIYNEIIFEFLFFKYGKIWMKEIRRDIPGLKEFIKRKK